MHRRPVWQCVPGPDALGIQKQVVLLQNRYRLIPCTDAVFSEKVYDPLGYDQLAFLTVVDVLKGQVEILDALQLFPFILAFGIQIEPPVTAGRGFLRGMPVVQPRGVCRYLHIHQQGSVRCLS